MQSSIIMRQQQQRVGRGAAAAAATPTRPAILVARPSRRCTQQRCAAAARLSSAEAGALAAAVTGLLAAAVPAAGAAEVLEAAAATGPSLPFALGSGAAIAGLGALLVATDPQKRRTEQMAQTGGDELEAVKNYFNTSGYERWRKIYGETDDVNKVQLDIRKGHAQTVEKVLKWVDEEGGLEGTTVCDAGCGTGSLAIPLALRGATVSASDISSAMASEAQQQYEKAAKAASKAPKVAPKFEAMDLGSVSGRFHTVTCLDVMIHYPQDKADGMVKHLASLADKRLIVSFAPKTPYYSVLKRIGELFPGPSKATRAYLHAEADVEASLEREGFKVVKREMTATNFYFSRLLEAVRV